jgi:hypothetical protein
MHYSGLQQDGIGESVTAHLVHFLTNTSTLKHQPTLHLMWPIWSYNFIPPFLAKCIPEPILNHPRKTLVGPDAVQLTWPPPYQPAHLANIPMSYIVEVRDAPGAEWRPVAKGIKNPNYTVAGLRPDMGYGFRVRVANEYGVSEPSPVVSLSSRWACKWRVGVK